MISFVTTGNLNYYYDQAKDGWWKYKGLNWRWKVKLWTDSGILKNCKLVWSQDLVNWYEGTAFDITVVPVFRYLDFYDLKGFRLDESVSNIFVGVMVPGLPDNPAGITFYLDDYSLLSTVKNSNWYLGNSHIRSRDARATGYFLNYWTGSVKTDKEKQCIRDLANRFMVIHGDIYLKDNTIRSQVINYINVDVQVFNVSGSDFNGIRSYVRNGKIYCCWFDYTTNHIWYGILDEVYGTEFQPATDLNIVWNIEPEPDLVVDNNYVYLFWSDWVGTARIYFSKRNLDGSQVIPPVVLFSTDWGLVSVDFCDNGNAIMLGLTRQEAGIWKLYQAKVDLDGNVLMSPVLVYTVGADKPVLLNIALDEDGYVHWVYKVSVSTQVWYGKTDGSGAVVMSFHWLSIYASFLVMKYNFVNKRVEGAYSVAKQVWFFAVDNGVLSENVLVFVEPNNVYNVEFFNLIVAKSYIFNWASLHDRFVFRRVGQTGSFEIVEVEQIGSGFVDGDYVFERNGSNQIRFGGGSWVNLNGDGYYECIDSSNVIKVKVFVWVDKLAIGSFVVNLKKAIKGEIGSFSGVRTNLDIISRPGHFSYLRPSVQSEYEEMIDIYLSGGNYYGDLTYKSLQEGVLTRDDIPVPEDKWSWVADNKIQLDSGEFDSDAEYKIRYKVKLEYESSVIDLGDNFDYLVWRPFWYVWNRKELFGYGVDKQEMLDFNFRNGEADLKFISDGIKSNSELIEYLGDRMRVISNDNWDFINDNRGIRVNVRELNLQARYVFKYRILVPRRDIGADIIVEMAYSDNGVDFSGFFEVEKGQVLEYHRYWKYRVRFFNVRDKNDIRLRSLVVASYQWRREI